MKRTELKRLVKAILKEVEHRESDMENPEEKREVQIGKEILKLSTTRIRTTDPKANSEFFGGQLEKIKPLADELIKMHGQSTNEDMAFTNNVECGADGISEGNVISDLNISGHDFAPIEQNFERIKSAWKQIMNNRGNVENTNEFINHLYDAASLLQNDCAKLKKKLEAGLQ